MTNDYTEKLESRKYKRIPEITELLDICLKDTADYALIRIFLSQLQANNLYIMQ